MKQIITVMAAAVVSCGVSYGQDKAGPNSERLKDFGPMIGTWRYEGPLLEDEPDVAKKESNFVFQFSWRRILDKSAVEENWSVEYEGGTKVSGKSLIGWNADKNEIVYGGMDSLGGITLGTTTPDTVNKTMPLADELTAADYIAFLKPFEGSWKSTISSDGEVIEGTWRGRLSSTKACYVSQGESTGLPSYQGVDGYDPVSKKWTVASFDSAGGFALFTLAFDGVKKGQVFGAGVTGRSEERQFKPDGTTTTVTSKFSCTECTEKRIVYVLTEQMENGESKPDQTITMDRQPERGRRGKQ